METSLPARQSDGHIRSDLPISISPTKEMNEVFLPTLNLLRSRMVASIRGILSEQSESSLEGNGSWKYNQAHESKRLTSPLPACQSDGHVRSEFHLHFTNKGNEWNIFSQHWTFHFHIADIYSSWHYLNPIRSSLLLAELCCDGNCLGNSLCAWYFKNRSRFSFHFKQIYFSYPPKGGAPGVSAPC